MPQVQEFRTYVENRMVDFEKQTGIVVERILDTRSIRYAIHFPENFFLFWSTIT